MTQNPPRSAPMTYGKALACVIIAVARAQKIRGSSAEDHLRQISGNAALPQAILRALQAPADTVTPGWAEELLQPALVVGYIGSLPPTAGVQLFGMAQLNLPSQYPAASIISRSDTTIKHQWHTEGQPIRVGKLPIGAAKLPDGRLAFIVTATWELLTQSPVAASVIETLMAEDASLALDSAMLGDDPATDHSSGGLAAGAVAVTGTGSAATDMRALFAAIPNLVRPILVMNHTQSIGLDAAGLRLRDGSVAGAPVLLSPKMADGEALLIDGVDLLTGGGVVPRVEVRTTGVVHEEDTSPAPIVDGAGVQAKPARSFFQTDTTGIKSLLPVSWGMRAADRVAMLSGATW